MGKVQIIKIATEPRFEPGGGFSEVQVATFVIYNDVSPNGYDGPFSVRVPKADGWELALKQAIEVQANAVQTIRA